MRSARSPSRAELARHVDRIVMRPTGSGAAPHYVASGEWDFAESRPEMEQASSLLGRGTCMVAGARNAPNLPALLCPFEIPILKVAA